MRATRNFHDRNSTNKWTGRWPVPAERRDEAQGGEDGEAADRGGAPGEFEPTKFSSVLFVFFV